MEYYKIILVFGIYSFMGWYACTNTIKKIIKKIGIHRKYYPQNYIMPHRKIRKIFQIRYIHFQIKLDMNFDYLFRSSYMPV